MPRLTIDCDFLKSYAKLEKHVQRAVDEVFAKFAEHTFAGLHLERLGGSKDPRIRTIKITNFWRGLVLAPTSGEEYTLLCVLPHDEANRYATSKKFSVNLAIGVAEVRDQGGLEAIEPALRDAASATETRLFDAVGDGELVALGVDRDVLPLVRLLTSEAHLQAMENLLPKAQYNALLGLASGMDPDEVWQEVCSYLGGNDVPEVIDPHDITAAMARTPDRYVRVSGPEELADMLANPFAVWRNYLHPRQSRVAFAATRGPMLVTGGAGTGKTVTVLHRAVHLADQLPAGAGRDILITTYDRGLAEALQDQLVQLTDDQRLLSRIDVVNVSRFAYQVVAQARGVNPDIVQGYAESALWKAASRQIGGALTPKFLKDEWEQVILAQALIGRDDYLRCERTGRGRSIGSRREQAWAAMSEVAQKLRQSDKFTHLQVAVEAEAILAQRQAPYRHVLVDEGQDLHPAVWRMLRRAAAPGPDDLFIVADPHQRIYDNRVSLRSLGIKVQGRSHRLTENYRTTQEILEWSVRMLGGKAAAGLDDMSVDLAGYRSPVHGARPVVTGYRDWPAEVDGVVTLVRNWLAADIEPDAIGIAARTSAKVKDIKAALDDAGITSSDKARPSAVRLDTMHGMKGKEFRCVAVVGVDSSGVPLSVAVTPHEEDPTAHEQDTQRERCLLFVACTRPRDALHVSHSGIPSAFLA